ncbi:MAG: molybdopterin-dependent oxidoreductase [Deltaproteobacteria bacterium]|nr:molybdopterin-dependent oxidoreductase [Deltaproteobacteria bacterium]
MKKEWTWNEGDIKVVRSIARTAPGCHNGCGVLLYVKDGRLVKVEGDPDFPLNRGRLCPRCVALPEVVYHPDRLLHPLKRVGERGEGKWERIPWDEAFDSIAGKMAEIRRQYGAESMVFCQGTGRDIMPYISRLAYSYGSPNIITFGPLHGNACWWPKVIGMNTLLGAYAVADCAQSFPDRYDNKDWKVPECMIVWGNDPVMSSPDAFMGHWLVECMKYGTELIVIDPRKTWLASRAKIWMQIRPGTDSALALGMLNIIINEGLLDEEFLEKWTHGFEELKKRVQDYPPDKVSEITWLPEKQIIDAARMYGKSKPASIQWGVALDQTKECMPTLHAIMAMWAVTGNIDVPGGNVFSRKLFDMDRMFHWGSELMSDKQWDRKLGKGIYPLIDMHPYFPGPGEAMIEQMLTGNPYPIKGSWIQTTNTIACGAADPKRSYDAFRKMDLNVVVDLFMTPTAMAFADYVLPAVTYSEKEGVAIPVGSSTLVGTINKAIEPVGESKSDLEINYEIGRKLDPEAWPWKGIHEMMDVLVRPTGMTFAELRDKGFACDEFSYRRYEKGKLRPDKKSGFNTPTGKVELYSTVFEKCGLDPLPYFEEPPESPVNPPGITKEYPLLLITGPRVMGFFHSEHRQIPSLRRMNPDPLTEIHPETAESLGITDGDWIYIESGYGRCKQRAKVTDIIHPRIVSAQHGWWFPEKPGPEPGLFGVWESNINLLLPSGWTGRSGFGYPFKTQMCRIYKVGEA